MEINKKEILIGIIIPSIAILVSLLNDNTWVPIITIIISLIGVFIWLVFNNKKVAIWIISGMVFTSVTISLFYIKAAINNTNTSKVISNSHKDDSINKTDSLKKDSSKLSQKTNVIVNEKVSRAKLLTEPIQIIKDSIRVGDKEYIDSIWVLQTKYLDIHEKKGASEQNKLYYYPELVFDEKLLEKLEVENPPVYQMKFNSDKVRLNICDSTETVSFPLIKVVIRNIGNASATIYGLESKEIFLLNGASAQGNKLLLPLNETKRLYIGEELIFNNPIHLESNNVGTIEFSPTFRDKDVCRGITPCSHIFAVYIKYFDGVKKSSHLLGYYEIQDSLMGC